MQRLQGMQRTMHPAIDIAYLNGPDVAPLALTDDEILDAVEAGCARRAVARR